MNRFCSGQNPISHSQLNSHRLLIITQKINNEKIINNKNSEQKEEIKVANPNPKPIVQTIPPIMPEVVKPIIKEEVKPLPIIKEEVKPTLANDIDKIISKQRKRKQ